ncbi:MAG: hypothetical protein KC609_23605 [Myxococcales bacterium]|nr:hypothetical protein [Myxococcales bacterium]
MSTASEFYHLTTSSAGRLTLFDTETVLRRCVTALISRIRTTGLMFSLVDDHFHYVLEGTREEVGLIARAVSNSIRRLSGRKLSPTYIQPVESRRHIARLIEYLALQSERHGLLGHPALYTGSSFLDLIGARACGFPATLFLKFPRLRRAQLYETVGLAPPLSELSLDALRGESAERLLALAEAIYAYGGDRGSQPDTSRRVRRLVAGVGRALEMRDEELSRILGVAPRSVRRYAASMEVRAELPSGCRALLTRYLLEQSVQRAKASQAAN